MAYPSRRSNKQGSSVHVASWPDGAGSPARWRCEDQSRRNPAPPLSMYVEVLWLGFVFLVLVKLNSLQSSKYGLPSSLSFF